MLRKVIIWGATGHAIVLYEFITSLGYELIALFDNDRNVSSPFPNVSLYYGITGFKHWIQENQDQEVTGLVAIGGANGRDRVMIQRKLEVWHVNPITAVHPTAFVARDVQLSKGCQILANASVCSRVKVGEACIINTGASVDHECVLGDGVHIAPGATLAGCVSVGDYSMIGAGAVVLPRIRIGRDVVVGAGAVVTRDIADNKVAFGNPARVRRSNIPNPEGFIES